MVLLRKNSIGLDIADRSIELVELVKRGARFEVLSMGRTVLSNGIVERGRIKDKEKLGEAIKATMQNSVPSPIKGDNIVFGFPESQVFTYIFEIDYNKKSDLEAEVRRALEKNVPIESEDLLFTYKIHEKKKIVKDKRGRKKENTVHQAVAVAMSKKISTEWMDFFQSQKIPVAYFDTETFSIFRSTREQFITDSVCILDMGARVTNISISSKNRLIYSHSIPVGGDAITKNMSSIRVNAEGKQLEEKMAEKAKIKFGILDDWDFQKESSLIIQSVLRTIAQETKSALTYVKSQYKVQVKELALVGGTSKMKGVVEYFDKSFASFTSSAEEDDNKEGANIDEEKIKVKLGSSNILPFKDQVEYLESVGLAIFGLENKFKKTCPVISTKAFDKIKKDQENLKKDKEKKEKLAAKQEKEPGWFKSHPKEAQLLVVVVLGLILLIGAFWFRSYSDKKRASEMPFGTTNEFVKKQISLDVPIVLEARDMKPGRVFGRIKSDIIETAAEYSVVVSESKTRIEADLKSGEKTWIEPININSGDSLVFPLQVDWLTYFDSDLRTTALSQVKEMLQNETFTFDTMEQVELVKASSTWVMKNSVFLSLQSDSEFLESDVFDVEASKKEGEPEEVVEAEDSQVSMPYDIIEEKNSSEELADPDNLSLFELSQALLKAKEGNQKYATITQTSTGWLNARSGPGSEYDAVKRLNVGENYLIVEEQGSWVKLKIGENEELWVVIEYLDIE